MNGLCIENASVQEFPRLYNIGHLKSVCMRFKSPYFRNIPIDKIRDGNDPKLMNNIKNIYIFTNDYG